MSDNIDFRALWNLPKATAPNINEILKRANQLTRREKVKIWLCNIVLSVAVMIDVNIWWHLKPQLITTKIGLTLMIAAMVIFVITSNRLYPLLTKADEETDTNLFLTQMIRIKHKREFMNTIVQNGYFLMLCVGLALYFIEDISHKNILFQACVYGLTFLFMGIAWFYAIRNAKKQRKAINEIIEKLEAINQQLQN